MTSPQLTSAQGPNLQFPLNQDSSGSPPTLAIVNVSVIDGTAVTAHADQTVLIAGDRIVEVGSAQDVGVPPEAEVVDGSGRYLMPGLWDMHTHVTMFGSGSAALTLYLANGVTGIRDMGADRFSEAKALRDSIASGLLLGPRMYIATPFVEHPAWLAAAREIYEEAGVSTDWAEERFGPSSPEEAVRWVDSITTLGADHLKVRNWPDVEVGQALMTRAAEHDLPVVGHANRPFPTEGMASLEHGLWPPHEVSDSEREALWESLVVNGIPFVVTLTYWPGRLQSVDSLLANLDPARNPAYRYVLGETLERWRGDYEARRLETPVDWSVAYEAELRNLREMKSAGVTIMPGSDAPSPQVLPGFGLHEELVLLVEISGTTTLEALQAATLEPAQFLGLEDSLGTVEAGKIANLVILDGNPLADIRNTQRIHGVVLNGEMLDRALLDRLLGAVEEAAR